MLPVFCPACFHTLETAAISSSTSCEVQLQAYLITTYAYTAQYPLLLVRDPCQIVLPRDRRVSVGVRHNGQSIVRSFAKVVGRSANELGQPRPVSHAHRQQS